MAWTLHQQQALALCPKFTGLLSFLGSLFIILDIIRSNNKVNHAYGRLLLMLSCFDLSTSIAQGLSTWPIPKESGALYAIGNQQTCNGQGFFTQLGVGAPIYNCSLSFYYLLVIAFGYKEKHMLFIERILHIVPLSFAFCTAVMGIPLTLYNNAGLWCWISALPGSCGNDHHGDSELCIRGQNAWIYRWAIYYGPVWLCVLTITINMIIVSIFVYSKTKSSGSRPATERQPNEKALPTTEQAPKEDSSRDDENDNNNTNNSSSLTNEVFWQAFYYVLGFYITWIIPTYLRALQTFEKPVDYWIILWMSILLPMQGFFNFLVYFRPRILLYYQQRQQHKQNNSVTLKDIHKNNNGRKSHDDNSNNNIQELEAADPIYVLSTTNE